MANFRIPLNGDSTKRLFSKRHELIACGYERIVIGEKGAYVEFLPSQMMSENIFIPENTKWRIRNENAYYIEFRSKRDNVMIYFQKKLVKYADYLLGYYYISPSELYLEDRSPVRVLGNSRCGIQSQLRDFI